MLDGNIKASEGNISVQIYGSGWWLDCGVLGGQKNGGVQVNCYTSDGFEANAVTVQYDSWYMMRFEVNPDATTISFFADGQPIGSYTPSDPAAFKQTQVNVGLRIWSQDGGLTTGYIDDVRVGRFGQQ